MTATTKFPGDLYANAAEVGNIAKGAQNGIGNDLKSLAASTPIILPPIIPIVVQIPSMWRAKSGMKSFMKALFERHATSISGVDTELTLNTVTTSIGKDGQVLEVPTNASRANPTPTFTWQELVGNPIWKFHEEWIQSITNPIDSRTRATEGDAPFTAENYSMTMMFIQPDPTFHAKNIVDAYFIANMFPKTTGPNGFGKEDGNFKTETRSIAYSGILQKNSRVLDIGRDIMAALNIPSTDWWKASPITDGIDKALRGLGIEEEVANAIRDQSS